MALMATTLALRTSLLVALLLVALLVLVMAVSTGMLTASLLEDSKAEVEAVILEEEATLAVVEEAQLVVTAMANGKMASTSQDLPTHVSSVSSSVLPTTLPSNKLVSTSRSTTTFQLRLLVKACQNQLPHSPTLPSMTISSATLSTLATTFPHQCRNTLFLLSWAVVISWLVLKLDLERLVVSSFPSLLKLSKTVQVQLWVQVVAVTDVNVRHTPLP